MTFSEFWGSPLPLVNFAFLIIHEEVPVFISLAATAITQWIHGTPDKKDFEDDLATFVILQLLSNSQQAL